MSKRPAESDEEDNKPGLGPGRYELYMDCTICAESFEINEIIKRNKKDVKEEENKSDDIAVNPITVVDAEKQSSSKDEAVPNDVEYRVIVHLVLLSLLQHSLVMIL